MTSCRGEVCREGDVASQTCFPVSRDRPELGVPPLGYWLLATGYWPLEGRLSNLFPRSRERPALAERPLGNWQLATGHWLPATGYWLPASGNAEACELHRALLESNWEGPTK